MRHEKQVVAYVRVSTERQASEGISLDAQRARIEAWCAMTGANLAAVHTDAGLSGSKASNRPALQEALTQVCRIHGILVVYSLSRLARSTKNAIEIAEKLEKAGADLVSLTEQIDTTSAAGKMIFRILAVLSEFESDLVSERTAAALAHLKKSGKRYSGTVPYGLSLRGDRLVPVKEEQEIVILIHRLRKRGLSLRKISRRLASRGIRTKRGGAQWSPKVLAAILRRTADARKAA
jgi:site-specific DNA recombinase